MTSLREQLEAIQSEMDDTLAGEVCPHCPRLLAKVRQLMDECKLQAEVIHVFHGKENEKPMADCTSERCKQVLICLAPMEEG